MTIKVTVPDGHNPKHPDDAEWYKLKWSDYLADRSDTIVPSTGSTWTVPAGITKDSDDIVDTETNTRIKVSGGTSGQRYLLKNTITTVGGRTKVGYIELLVSDDPNNIR